MAAPVEKKVQWSTAVSAVVGVLLTVLNGAVGNSQLMGTLPAWLQTLLTLFVPPLATFAAGYLAPHTSRVTPVPDQPTASGVDKAA